MFRYEVMPPELTSLTRVWYVVDHDRDVWLRGLGTNGPTGHRVFLLCVRGARIPFELDPFVEEQGVPVHQITIFGHSHTAAFTHGIQAHSFDDPEERFAIEELASEAVLAFLTARAAQLGAPAPGLRVRLISGDCPIYGLADFGYRDGVPTDGETND
ncbi:hypothetical protein [Cellulomonas xiejunii]|jgi:hypothetical protein|uniref:Uncharacterized protein n=1 Tax=Cellulomonas xiejunii TaxID=2968083 RepID=A0ABY5KRJ8_9CELL|nr:hypothetical protein [Cellulomonas xiejunii]MCC2314057.1 hypothetical protein [Cellulomonas xiejunii]MCC2322318.1 hypothetical protein [Cellulomonas xiejunii]UUI72369.1 hypothetical protein NP048_02550 [Cellulomonas xiejunii]